MVVITGLKFCFGAPKVMFGGVAYLIVVLYMTAFSWHYSLRGQFDESRQSQGGMVVCILSVDDGGGKS